MTQKTPAASVERLAADYPGERRAASGALVLGAVAAAVAAIPPLIVRRLLDDAIPNREAASINALAVGLVVVPVIGALLASAHERRFEEIAQRLSAGLRARVAASVRSEAGSGPGGGKAPLMAGAAAGALDEVETSLGSSLPRMTAAGFSALAGIIAALFIAPLVAVVSFALVPVFVGLVRRMDRFGADAAARRRTHRERVTSFVHEAAGPASQPASHLQERLETHAQADAVEAARDAVVARRMDLGLSAIVASASGLLWIAAGHRVAGGATSIGSIVAITLYQIRLFQSARRLTSDPPRSPAAPLEIIYECIDLAPEAGPREPGRALQRLQGRVTFDGVSFGGKSAQPLRDVSFDVPPGRMLVVVGTAGAGQTAIATLLTRDADPDAGSVLLDGWDLRELTMDTVARGVGVLRPGSERLGSELPGTLEQGSVRDYLKEARPSATETQIAAAARAVQLHDAITTEPTGFDTPLRALAHTEGERTRLTIAALLLKDPAVIIVEEPRRAGATGKEERLVERAIAELVRNRTSIVLASRRATLSQASQIVVLDGGRVAERGSHDELLGAGGLYARLFREQFSAEPRIADVIA